MKKLLLALVIILIPSIGLAQQCIEDRIARLGVTTVSGSIPSSDACTPRGTAAFYWDGEYTADRNDACVSGGTKDGTISGATISTDQNHTSGGAYAYDQTAASQYLQWTITTKDIFDLDEGSMTFWAYPTASTNTTRLFTADAGDFNNRLRVDLRTYNDIAVMWEVNNVGNTTYYSKDNCEPDQLLNDTAWNKIQLEWSIASDILRININGAGWCTLDTTARGTQSAAPATINLGADVWVETIYLDDVWIWTSYGQSN